METLGIISVVLLSILLIICVALLFKNKKENNAMTVKDYLELRSYIQMCFGEQDKLNQKINDIIVKSMAINNDSVINAVTQNAGLQQQQLNDIMARLNKMLESTSENMKNATLVLQEGLVRLGTNAPNG